MAVNTLNDVWTLYRASRAVVGTRTAPETERLYRLHLAPVLGSVDVQKIKLPQVEALHRSMKETPYQANRVLVMLRALIKYAMAMEWVLTRNPASYVKAYPERKRRRHMKPGEAPAIATAIREHETHAPVACAFLWILLFTGARPNEIKSAKWRDLVGNKIVLQEHKSDRKGTERVIILPEVAMEKLLKLIPRGHDDSKIIQLANPEYVWRYVRDEAQCHDLRVYDLRHTFGTYALENGFTLDQIGEALDHANPATTKIYAEMSVRARNKITADTSAAILRDMDVRLVDMDTVEALS